mmetsp:Transcript_6575/g.24399  ORF Transcript_6575/g.24399 Transcript_6575/m.24399 type:complete len:525 (-) Transcript_6575:445-2019(-)
MLQGLKNARRRTKQALFEKGAQNSEHVPVTDITILSETLEEIQELHKANEQVGQSAKVLAEAIDAIAVHFERVALAASVLPGAEFEDKKSLLRGHLRQKLEQAKLTLETSTANGLHSYVEQYQSKEEERRIASLRQRLGEVQQLRLDFDAYRRKVAALDQRVFAGDAASPETVKMQQTQQDKHRKLATATASFDKSFKTLLSDMQYCYKEMGGRLYDSTRTYLLAQTACLYTLGSAFDDYIVPMEANEEEDLSSCLFELKPAEVIKTDDEQDMSKAQGLSSGGESFPSRDTNVDSARTPLASSGADNDAKEDEAESVQDANIAGEDATQLDEEEQEAAEKYEEGPDAAGSQAEDLEAGDEAGDEEENNLQDGAAVMEEEEMEVADEDHADTVVNAGADAEVEEAVADEREHQSEQEALKHLISEADTKDAGDGAPSEGGTATPIEPLTPQKDFESDLQTAEQEALPADVDAVPSASETAEGEALATETATEEQAAIAAEVDEIAEQISSVSVSLTQGDPKVEAM